MKPRKKPPSMRDCISDHLCASSSDLAIKIKTTQPSVKSRINCSVKFPARPPGAPPSRLCLFWIQPFVFPLRETGWGASACVDHLPRDSGQRRMRGGEVKTTWEEARMQGTEKERWRKPVTNWRRRRETRGGSVLAVALTARTADTRGVCLCWLKAKKKCPHFHVSFVFFSTRRLVYASDSLHLTFWDGVHNSRRQQGGEARPPLVSFFVCARG